MLVVVNSTAKLGVRLRRTWHQHSKPPSESERTSRIDLFPESATSIAAEHRLVVLVMSPGCEN